MDKSIILVFNLMLGSIFLTLFISDNLSFEFIKRIEDRINQNNVLKLILFVIVLLTFGIASVLNALLNLPAENYFIDIAVLLIGAIVLALTYFTEINYFKRINYFYFMLSLWMTLRCFYSSYVILKS